MPFDPDIIILQMELNKETFTIPYKYHKLIYQVLHYRKRSCYDKDNKVFHRKVRDRIRILLHGRLISAKTIKQRQNESRTLT